MVSFEARNGDVDRHETLVAFKWEGYRTTGADELYHCVWESMEGTLKMKAPISGEICRFNEKEMKNLVSADWVVEILAAEDKLPQHLLTEDEFAGITQKLGRGLFFDPE